MEDTEARRPDDGQIQRGRRDGGGEGDVSRSAGSAWRVLRPIAAGLVVVAVALAVIIWLPLDAQVEADVREAIVGYETSAEAAWPSDQQITLPLEESDRAALAAEVERRRAAFATEEALAHYGPELAVQDFAASARRDWPWIVTGWRARIVYFDFVRQTLRGDVIVRAGVLRARQRRRMSTEQERLVAPRWLWDAEGVVYEYTLRDTGEAWKVVSSAQWGTCGPYGEDPTPGRG